MPAPGTDTLFTGSIPELYEQLLVPLIFEPFADDLARRVADLQPQHVLETAAGTGVRRRVPGPSSGTRPMRCSCPSPTPASMSSSASSA